MMRCAMRVVRAMPVIHGLVEELRREAVGADCKGKYVAVRRHKAHGYERTKSERDQQDARDQLAASSTN